MPPAQKTPAKTSDRLPGGYKVGEKVFYTGSSETWDDGDKVVHGQQGEVTGPATLKNHTGVEVRFAGNKDSIGCYLCQVSRAAPPPLPGGYKMGDKVFYTAENYTFADGDKLMHGQQGEVVGPVTGGCYRGIGVKVRFPGNKGVAVRFPGNKDDLACFLTEVSRAAPPAPPGAAADQEEVAVVGERTFAQRDAECRKRAIDLEAETPRKRGRGASAALEERVVSARSVCTAAVDKRARGLMQPAINQWLADQINEATLEQRKAKARYRAAAEHAQLTELERASAEYTEAVSARTKAEAALATSEAALATSEAAEDAAEAKLEAVLRELERGQPGPSGVKAE